ncbi:MAG: hypothetical protein JWO61_71 [Candidatus Saccharibacteria bacterium]|nr:hypothetical protein [Candidatus Saccharibacteria bacterium]
MSALDIETIPSPAELAPDPRLKLKYILDRIVGLATRPPEQVVISPELEAEILIEELRVVADPFKQLDYAADLLPSLPESKVESDLSPLIDTISHDTLEYLKEQEAEARTAHRISLGFEATLTCIRAWDVHRTDDTVELAKYAIDHTGEYDGREPSPVSKTYHLALERAKNSNIPFDEALQAVNDEILGTLGDDHRYEYPFLYDRNVSALSDKKYRFRSHPRDAVA